MRVLVVEDDAKIASFVVRGLKQAGYAVDHAPDGETGLALAESTDYDAAVVDVMLPQLDGISLVKRLRASRRPLPVLFLSAKSSVDDRVRGLQAGGDDYLTKPFAFAELLARVQALVRRQRVLGAHAGPAPEGATVRFGVHVLRVAERRLERDGHDVPLTSGEFALLRALALNPNRPLGRDRLIELAHGREHEATDRSIDVQVMRLRKLIEADPARPRHIRTVWGVGYVFVPEAPP